MISSVHRSALTALALGVTLGVARAGLAAGGAEAADRREAFFGPSYPPPLPEAPLGWVGSQGYGAWIFPRPNRQALPLGAPRDGGVVPLVSREEQRADEPCGSFLRVAGGWMCSKRSATTAPDSPWLLANRWTTPAPGPLPFEYAVSFGAPMLSRLPRPGETLPGVGDRDVPLRGWHDVHDDLALDAPITPNGPLPDFLRDGGAAPTPWGPPRALFIKRVPRGSTVAYTRAFEALGQVWVLTTDLKLIPARGLKRFGRSSFQGVALGEGLTLPLAWGRARGTPLYRREGDGWQPTARRIEPRALLPLSGVTARAGRRTYYRLRDGALWVALDEAAVAEAPDGVPYEVRDGGKWVYVQRRRGTLTLFDGARPVFTTLVSVGIDGATPTGRYFVDSKHHHTTMSGERGEPRRFWMSEVPWSIYYDQPFALHAAYWHDNFGEPMSGGCVTLSPLDAQRIFGWTDPPLPEGWGMVQARFGQPRTFILVKD